MRKLLASFVGTPAALSLVLGAAFGTGCATAFHDSKTPSGQYCSDMPVYLNGQADPDRPFHRIKPIATPMKALTAPERLEALRVEACALGGDAVINAGDEETQTPDHSVIVRASGYAVRWIAPATRGPTIHQSTGTGSIGAPAGIAATAPPPAATPAPAPESTEAGGAAVPSKSPAIAPKKAK